MKWCRKYQFLIAIICVCLVAICICVLNFSYLYNAFLINRAIRISRSYKYTPMTYRFDCYVEKLQACTPDDIETPQIYYVAIAPGGNYNEANPEEPKKVTVISIDYICKQPLADSCSIWVDDQRMDHHLDYTPLLSSESYPEGQCFDPRRLDYELLFKTDVNFSEFKYYDKSTTVKFALSYKGELVTPIITLNRSIHRPYDRSSLIYVYPWDGNYFSTNPNELKIFKTKEIEEEDKKISEDCCTYTGV